MQVVKGVANNFEAFFKIFHETLLLNGWKVVSDTIQDYGALIGNSVKLNKSKSDTVNKVVVYQGDGILPEYKPTIEVTYIINNKFAQGALLFRGAYSWNRELNKLYNPSNHYAYISWSEVLSILYHFNIDNTHIALVTSQNSYFQDAYLGFINPLCLPTEYTYPMYVGASQSTLYSDRAVFETSFNHLNLNSSTNSSFLLNKQRSSFNNATIQGLLYTNDNQWKQVYVGNQTPTIRCVIDNFKFYDNSKYKNIYENTNFKDYNFNFNNFENSIMLEPIYIQNIASNDDLSTIGSFKSFFKCYGEQQINDVTQINGRKYKIFRIMNTSYFYALEDI